MSGCVGVNIANAKIRKCCGWPRAPATVGFYHTRLKKCCDACNNRDVAPFEVDELYERVIAPVEE